MTLSAQGWKDAAVLSDEIPGGDRLPDLVIRFRADRAALDRACPPPAYLRREAALRPLLGEWRETLDTLPFERLTRADRADWLLLRSLLDADERRLREDAARFRAAADALLPFAEGLIALDDDRRAFRTVEPERAAETLDRAAERIQRLRAELKPGAPDAADVATAAQAVRIAGELKNMLAAWHGFYHGYDPAFDWWVQKPYAALDQALGEYGGFLRREIAGVPDDAVLGVPIGRDALTAELAYVQIADSPEELIAAARAEMDWCLDELRAAAKDMGLGDDWREALSRVKADHVAPGGQPALVRDLAWEAIEYVEANGLVTVPPLARDVWRMDMMSADRQKVNPFFLGGETIVVSFPTADMEHARKRMSLRGNNRAFARATVHHELIPGHHLQMFFQERFRPYRRAFQTPFWIEGWALHWEFLLWERGFPRTPEERIGMLFWRMHRCARVVFSLEFHLGRRTAEECVRMLVEEAGHEPDNALAEVRRSFEGAYHPLYQMAYLVGAWQVHALYRELVGGGRLTDREFHDAVLRENCMPISMLRALLTGEPLTRDGLPLRRVTPPPSPAAALDSRT